MIFNVQFGGFGSVMRCVMMMPVRQMCMVCGLLVASSFVVHGSFPVVSRRVFMMLCCLVMMLCRLL